MGDRQAGSQGTTVSSDDSRRVRIGVVGFGYWGPNHVRVLTRAAGTDTVVIDPDAGQRERAAALFPGVPVFASLDDCDLALDGVVVCSPPATHLAVTEQAFARGCHVLVEKPLALSGDEAQAMVNLADQAGKRLMTGHIYDFNAATFWMEEQARQGRYGTVRYLDAQRLAVGGYRTDANVMWDMAPHDLCLMRRIVGRWPSAVNAWAEDHSRLGVADVAHMRLEFPGTDTVGYIKVSWLNPVKVRRLTIVGDANMVVFDDAADPNAPLTVIATGATSALGEGARHPVPGSYPEELIDSPVIEPVEPLAAEVAHFLHSVRTGEAPTRGTGLDGLQVVRILEAADRSAQLGETVAVPAVTEAIGAPR